jgi:glyoxylase-like metal-dependent hydrolase (beta-lactamase superfamily II)
MTYPHAEPPAEGGLTQVAPGVLWLRMPLPFVLNHINLWLLQDGEGWTIVDCGFATSEARGYWDSIFAMQLPGKPPLAHITRVMVTHFHPDHIGLCHWLCERFGLIPWMTQAEYFQAHVAHARVGGAQREAMGGLMQRHGLTDERLEHIVTRENLYLKGVPKLPEAYRRIRDNELIRIGAHDWRVMVGHGHAPEHASLYCEALGVLISGDMLLPRISTNVSIWPSAPEADPVGDFLAALARYAELPDGTLVLPSHGLPFYGHHARIAALREHHGVRLERLRVACVKPQRAVDVIDLLFERKIEGHHIMFAVGEAIAHMNYLVQRGELTRGRNDLGQVTFATVA